MLSIWQCKGSLSLELVLLILAAHLMQHQCQSDLRNMPDEKADSHNNLEQKRPLFQYASRDGIVHIRLASDKLGNFSESVMLHVFLRAILLHQQLLVRGIGFVEPIDTINMDVMHLTQPYTIRHWQPVISLISSNDQLQWSFQIDMNQTRQDPWRPFHLEMVLPNSAANSAFQLQVDDWTRHGFYYPRAYLIKHPIPAPFKYAIVFSTFFKDQRAMMIELLLKHIEYHSILGFSLHLVYVHGDYLGPMLNDNRIQAMIDTGRLELIYWDVFPRYSTPVWEYADQAIMYNHALLAMWGESMRVAFLDLDEFLAFKSRTTIDELYGSCFQSGQLQVLQRFDAICATCEMGTNELPVWQANDVWTALSQYTLLRKDTGGLSLDLGKCIAEADNVHSFFVHDAVLRHHFQPALVPQNCAFLVHMVSMMTPRTSRDRFEEDKSWQWFLPSDNTS